MQSAELEKLKLWRRSPIAFIEGMWGLVPQPIVCTEPACDHLCVVCYGEFERGKHLSWQQYLILRAVERALTGDAPKRISVASGHGTGKSSTLSWLTFWFLFTREDSQVGATAPAFNQLFDVLWKELAVWHNRMPKNFHDLFIWQSSYLRVAESPETWFARARTGRKENPEAFAGIHGKHVALWADEASSVPDEIYRTAEGSLTNKDTLVVLISNATRLEGYFYDTHHDDKDSWQTLSFSSIDSPIVEEGFPERIKAKYGEDSNEYKFMVLGQFPSSEGMIDGWLPMFSEEDISNQVPDVGAWMKPTFLGVDPSGYGRNKTAWVLRDGFKLKVVGTEQKSTTVSVAEKTITFARHYGIDPRNVKVDNFGIGANIGQEIALGVNERIQAVNVGAAATNERFLNVRAEIYWNLREWIKKGGKLVRHDGWRQLLTVYYKSTLSGKIQVMSKEEMIRKGWDSPDIADAASLTFVSEYAGAARPPQTAGGSGRELSSKEISDIVHTY